MWSCLGPEYHCSETVRYDEQHWTSPQARNKESMAFLDKLLASDDGLDKIFQVVVLLVDIAP